MRWEAEEKVALEDSRFRARLIANFPEKAAEIQAIFEGKTSEDDGAFAEPMTEEEMDDYVPFSVEEVGAVTDLMRSFGFAFTD